MPRPELGTPSAGDEVFVIQPNHRMPNDVYPCTVQQVNRVTILIRSNDGRRTWKMRLENQSLTTAANRGNYDPHFVTVEQHAYDTELNEARRKIRALGIDIALGSFWWDADRRIQLADILVSTGAYALAMAESDAERGN